MAVSEKPDAAKNWRGWRLDNRGHVSERERLFITYQYHDRYTGDQTKARETLDVWKRTYPRDYRPANALAVPAQSGSATTTPRSKKRARPSAATRHMRFLDRIWRMH